MIYGFAGYCYCKTEVLRPSVEGGLRFERESNWAFRGVDIAGITQLTVSKLETTCFRETEFLQVIGVLSSCED
jgi:hypothetical protein